MLTLGLFTRLAALVLIGTMLFIILFIGQGRIWFEEQHPFLFLLLGLVFYFTEAAGGVQTISFLPGLGILFYLNVAVKVTVASYLNYNETHKTQRQKGNFFLCLFAFLFCFRFSNGSKNIL
jgi:hypothetical protein